MGLFERKKSDDDAPDLAPPPPHPVLTSYDAFASAPLDVLATAVLLAAYRDRDPDDRFIAFELHHAIEKWTGGDSRHIYLYVEEALEVLARSLLMVVDYGGTNADPYLALTRRGRQALESGAPERWIDPPPDPS
jgi:hypothetical protein